MMLSLDQILEGNLNLGDGADTVTLDGVTINQVEDHIKSLLGITVNSQGHYNRKPT